MLASVATHASPLTYSAIYEVSRVDVAHPDSTPQSWGIYEGATLSAEWTWDLDRALPYPNSNWSGFDEDGHYFHGPLVSYTINAGQLQVQGGDLAGHDGIIVGNAGSPPYQRSDQTDSLQISDELVSWEFAPIDDLYVDVTFFAFACSAWTKHPILLPDLQCESNDLSGSIELSMARGPFANIQASLKEIREIPEPCSFPLLAVGLVGLAVAKKRVR